MERDPLSIARKRLIELGHAEEDIESTERDVRAALDRAVEAALAAPYPDPETDGATEFAT
jgi:pyruvate dehydrogenase E1 component alpha subunit